MAKPTALSCVTSNDVCSLRAICAMVRCKTHELEETDYYGNTALLKACYFGRMEAAQILLQYGANVEAVNYFGQNALTLATCNGNMKLIHELLRYCSYNEFNKTTLTPALCVATLRKNWQLVEFYKELDRYHSQDIQTVHGLNYKDIMGYLKLRNVGKCPQQQHMHI